MTLLGPSDPTLGDRFSSPPREQDLATQPVRCRSTVDDSSRPETARRAAVVNVGITSPPLDDHLHLDVDDALPDMSLNMSVFASDTLRLGSLDPTVPEYPPRLGSPTPAVSDAATRPKRSRARTSPNEMSLMQAVICANGNRHIGDFGTALVDLIAYVDRSDELAAIEINELIQTAQRAFDEAVKQSEATREELQGESYDDALPWKLRNMR